jgi:hypothetical protein
MLLIIYALCAPLVAFASLVNDAATALVYVNALGLGVSNKNAATSFYSKTLGIKKQLSMPVANMGQGGWSEDINVFSGAHSSALVIMAWTDKRNVKNLPIKLTFAVESPKDTQARIASLGGTPVDMKTESNPDALYAKDLDGCLLELIQGSGPTVLKSIGIGVSNLNQSASWWAGATGMNQGSLMAYKEWSSISLTSSKASELLLMDWHETQKRPTKNMPIKLVFAASSTNDFTRSIQKQTPKGTQAGTMSMFQWEPIE